MLQSVDASLPNPSSSPSLGPLSSPMDVHPTSEVMVTMSKLFYDAVGPLYAQLERLLTKSDDYKIPALRV